MFLAYRLGYFKLNPGLESTPGVRISVVEGSSQPPSKMMLPLLRAQLVWAHLALVRLYGSSLQPTPGVKASQEVDVSRREPWPPQVRTAWLWSSLGRFRAEREHPVFSSGMNNSAEDRRTSLLNPPVIRIPTHFNIFSSQIPVLYLVDSTCCYWFNDGCCRRQCWCFRVRSWICCCHWGLRCCNHDHRSHWNKSFAIDIFTDWYFAFTNSSNGRHEQ